MGRARLRDLGITIGRLPTGPNNAITDVPGVLVGHCTLIADEPRVARTGVTVVVPRDGNIREDLVFAASHTFNGCGEMTGLAWVEESGILYQAIEAARSGSVAEGNVGGGTGMICHEFKGGIGTASRVIETASGQYTVGALVQTNYGERELLRIDGIPIGRELNGKHTPTPWSEAPSGGSIIVIIATDAPLLPDQCRRLAKRAMVGLARAGGVGHNGSGDLFFAFATGNHISTQPPFDAPLDVKMLRGPHLDPFFEAVPEAVEEAILNALTAAETMHGYKGRIAHALPLDEVQRVMAKYRPLV